MSQSPAALGEVLNTAAGFYFSGNLEQASSLVSQVLQVDPGNADALNLAWTIAWQSNRKSEAVALLERAVAARPDNAESIYNLGVCYEELGQLEPALKCYERAAQACPNLFPAHFKKGFLLAEFKRTDEAIAAYERAADLNPSAAIVYNNLGGVYSQVGKYQQAKELLQHALALDENYAEALGNLGGVLSMTGDMDSAIDLIQQAIAQKPDSFAAYKTLGDVFSKLRQHREAVCAYENAIALKPAFYEAYLGVAANYICMGNSAQAMPALARAQGLEPRRLAPVVGSCMACLPGHFASAEEIQTARRRYGVSLDDLEACLSLKDTEAIDDAARAIESVPPFYLACQGQDDRELQQKYGSIVSKIMAARYPQWSTPLSMPPVEPGTRLRVGIASSFFYAHPDWKLLMNGWVEALDRKSFKLFGYKTGGIRDGITDRAMEKFDSFFETQNFEELCQRMRADNLHVLIFPAAGTDPFTYKLAALRLAPVQCASWGHPDTSGLPTVDYFLTSDLMEPENAQQYYTEKLIRLPNLSTYYIPPELMPESEKLESYGLRKDAVRYLCLQSHHKYLPQHDMIYPAIAARVPDAQFLFVENPDGADAKLRQRLKQAFTAGGLDYDRYVTFLPRLTNAEYRGLCMLGDVFLDTLEWSGCTTTLEAVEQKVVPVTMPGKFMRGRHTSAILQMMDLTETIASSLDDYIDIAVRLGSDRAWRHEIAEKIGRRNYLLYRDPEVLVALEDFLKCCCQVG